MLSYKSKTHSNLLTGFMKRLFCLIVLFVLTNSGHICCHAVCLLLEVFIEMLNEATTWSKPVCFLFTRTNLHENIELTSSKSRGSLAGVPQMEALIKSTAPPCGYCEELQANVLESNGLVYDVKFSVYMNETRPVKFIFKPQN